MNYASIKSCDIANGPGVRVSLFVSGCTHHCKDCFNEEAWDFSYGEPFTDEVSDRLLAMLCPDYIRGITYLGGEPFDPHNQESLLLLSRRIRQELPEKSIWAFTGYVYGSNLPMLPGVTQELLSSLDVLVDGPLSLRRKISRCASGARATSASLICRKHSPPEQSFSGTKDNKDRRSLCQKSRFIIFPRTHRGCS